MIAVVDGVVLDARLATIPALDRAAWYGDAVFETFRTFGRRVLDLDARLARLVAGARALRFDSLPDRDALRRDLAAAIDAFEDDDAYVRVAVSRGLGSGGLFPTGGSRPITLVFVGRLPAFAARSLDAGLEVVTQRIALEPGGSRAPSAKVAAYVEPLLAGLDARAAGADDAIGHDREGIVLEGTTSNVFVRHGGVWTTPPASLGILVGITRGLARRLLDELGTPAREAVFSVQRLYDADEIVLTSSVRGLVPVTRVDGQPVGAGIPGPAFGALHEAYARLVAVSAKRVDAAPDSR